MVGRVWGHREQAWRHREHGHIQEDIGIKHRDMGGHGDTLGLVKGHGNELGDTAGRTLGTQCLLWLTSTASVNCMW